MAPRLKRCPSCRVHILEDAASCPFCSSRVPIKGLVAAAAGVLTLVAGIGCAYGCPDPCGGVGAAGGAGGATTSTGGSGHGGSGHGGSASSAGGGGGAGGSVSGTGGSGTGGSGTGGAASGTGGGK